MIQKWFILCYQNLENILDSIKLFFFTHFLSKNFIVKLCPHCFLPSLPAPQRRRGFHFLLPDPWPTFLESHRDFPPGTGNRCRRKQHDEKMSRKRPSSCQSRLVTTLNSPKIRSQTDCNLNQKATRKNMALNHSFQQEYSVQHRKKV